MRWPFVSRERFDDQRTELDRVRAELAAERDKNQRLWNFLNWRVGGGVAFDTSQLPEAYQPRAVAPKSATAAEDTAKTTRAVRAPGQARSEIAMFEVRQQAELNRLTVPQARVAQDQPVASEEQKMAGD